MVLKKLSMSFVEYADALFSAFAFTFFTWCGLFALVDVTVAAGHASSLGVAEPRVLSWAFVASFHVPRVGDVSLSERQSAFVSIEARPDSTCCRFAAVPGLESVQLFVFLRVGDPLQRLCCCNEPHIGPETDEFHFIYTAIPFACDLRAYS